jgi:geranylgeranyl diphosphate synthase, type I
MAANHPLGSDFPTFLARVRPEVEQRLVALWDGKIEACRRYGPDVVAMIDAARDLTLRGGKRYRAGLLAAGYFAAAPDAPIGPALQGGVALELLQAYLLMQDDWMDDDPTRRGGPSAHVLLRRQVGSTHIGNASAILASDFTSGLALTTLATIDVPAARLLEAVRLFLRIHEDVVIGQQIDLLNRAEDVEVMHDLKTGSYTVRGPLALGATLGGAPPDVLAALDRFAAPVGVAFQLRDDLLGTFARPEETGKPVGNDLRRGKRTAILAEAEARLDALGREALERVLGNALASDDEVRAVTEALATCGAQAAVIDRLLRLCEEAEALATEIPIAPAAQRVLAGAASALRPSTRSMVPPPDAPAGEARGRS